MNAIVKPSRRAVLLLLLAPRPAAAAEDPGFERTVIELVNEYRAQRRLVLLRIDPRLSATARAYARELSRRGAVEHIGHDGSRVEDRIAREGYAPALAAENLAANAGDARQVVDAWMHSPRHRDNLLYPGVSEAGAAREVREDLGNPYRTYDVLVLASPRDARPRRR